MTQKHWYQSKTIWGIAIAFIGFLVNHILKVDIEVPVNGDYQALYRHFLTLKENQDSVPAFISEAMSVIGTLLAIYGRVKADTEIKKINVIK